MSANANPAPPGPPRRTRDRWAVRLAAIGSAAATPVAAWWLIGDQTEQASRAVRLDYVIDPPAVAAPVEHSAGGAAAAAVVAAIVVLIRASRRSRLDRRWWGALVPVLVIGVIAAFGWRVLTMGTVGANIGAGLVLFFGGGLAILLLGWSLFWSARLLLLSRRSRRSADGR